MATRARIEANRRNALKSAGPKTAAGKAAAGPNGLSRGGFAAGLALPGEDTDLNQLRNSPNDRSLTVAAQ
jgi:hypothetical protein